MNCELGLVRSLSVSLWLGSVLSFMALAVWLEWRRRPLSDSVELRRVRVLVCALAGVLVIMGLGLLRSSILLSDRLERVEKAMHRAR